KLTSQTGRSKLFLVSGYSGIGKTSLVREIYKPITESKGHYISGKFDQYNRNMPYSALIQALTGLIKFILTEPPESIKSWKGKILESLGSNGKIITDVIPELEYIIGEQPEVVELSAQENANRFYVVFQNFIKIFTNINHPLAIFLDDLQWADNSSIDFIKTLLTDPSVKYLFLILSYRDNEIDKVHPLFQFIESLSTDSIPYEQIVLQPLQSEFLEEMLAETFLTSKDKVRSFTEIVHSKTGGNPFFVSELLKQLISDDLIHFSSSKGGWIWDEEKIKKSEVSDNVIELLLKRIKKLGETSQNILKFSSCIGSIFDLDTLHKIVDDQSNSFINSLKDTIQEELVQPLGESFKFLESLNSKNSKKKIKLNFRFQHDRIQQACYNLLEEVQKQETHLVIARILVEKSTEKDIDDVIFDIVSHYNQCYELLTDKKELENLIDFNLKAAKKAKQSSAYIPALEMIHVARKISEKVKVSSDKLTNLYIELAELEYLNGNLDESETYCMKALEHTDDVIIKAKIRDLLITQYSAKGMYDKALESINLALEPLGMHLPSENLMDIISEDMNTVLKMIEGKKVKSLINLPFMEDPKIKAAANIFISAIPTAYNKIPELFPVISLKMVKLHLNHGNLGDSYGFSMFGIV
ncbi:MAG: AAA family ATPase, partial [Leptospiraceae bacterium]|nr:AAA family ATPase [Leptospiraceae bacterium]